MGSSSTPLVLSLSVLLLSLSAADSRPFHRINRRSLSDLCANAEFPKLCEPLTDTLPSVSARAIAEAAIKVAAAKAAMAKDLASRLRAAPETGKVTASCLEVCEQNFSDTVDDLTKGLKLMTEDGNHTYMMSYLSAAIADTETCSDTFEDVPGLANPVEHTYSNLQRLNRNSISLAAALK